MFFPVRYADDFVILVCGTQEAAMAEKEIMVADLVRWTGLELSPEKSKITALTDRFEFLGCRLRLTWDRRYGYGPRVEIPKARAKNLRHKAKQLTGRSTTQWSLDQVLQKLNPILRGWANYYRYCTGAGDVLSYTRKLVMP